MESQVAGLKVIHYNTRAAGRPLLHHRGSVPVGGSLCMRVSGQHSELLKLGVDAVGYLLHLFGLEREMFLAEIYICL